MKRKHEPINLLSQQDESENDEMKKAKDHLQEELQEQTNNDLCLFCGIGLESFGDANVHIKACMGRRNTTFSSSSTNNDDDEKENENDFGLCEKSFICVLCDLDLSRRQLNSRCRHLKTCSKKHGVGISQLLSLVSPVAADIDYGSSSGSSSSSDSNPLLCDDAKQQQEQPKAVKVNAFAKMMQSSRQIGAMQSSDLSRAVPVANPASIIKNNKLLAKKGGSSSSSWFGKKRNAAGEVPYPPAFKLVSCPSMSHPIVVDGFQYATKSLSDTYFLTHFHADHYCGLDSSFDCGRIFGTPTTLAAVKLRMRIKGCLIPLLMEVEHTIQIGTATFKATLLPANHCPGACCILFKLPNGRSVLHTGDFRWSKKLLQSCPMYQALQSPVINKSLTVYLDTTYCEEQHIFPDQDEILDVVASTVQEELRVSGSGERTLFVFGAYGIGKEKVFMRVANDLKSKVHVEKSRRQLMMTFADWKPLDLAKLTENPAESCIWVCPLGHITFNGLRNLEAKTRGLGYTRIVAFKPTGWVNKSTATSSSSSQLVKRVKNNLCIYDVAYSEHSSFSELVDFVFTFKPFSIVPTVNTEKKEVKAQLDLLRKSTGIY